MNLISSINEELQEYGFVENEEKFIGKNFSEFYAETELNLQIANLLLLNSRARLSSWKTFRKYFPKKGAEQYAIVIYLHTKQCDEKILKIPSKKIKIEGVVENYKKLCLQKYNIDKEWSKTFFTCGLTDKDPQIVAFSLIALKAFIEETIDDEIAKKLYVLYAIPSFRRYIEFLCEGTNQDAMIGTLYRIYDCEAKKRNFVLNAIHSHKSDKKYPSLRDYILSQDTAHAVTLPLGYFNHIIFDEEYSNHSFAMKQGFSDLLKERSSSKENIIKARELVKIYFNTPTMENLKELNIFADEYIPYKKLTDIIMEEYQIAFQKSEEGLLDLFHFEEALVLLYLNSTSLLCTKAAICAIGAGCTYRPYFSVLYEEFERISASEDFVDAALIACRYTLNVDRKRLQTLFAEFKQFGKIILIDHLPKQTATEKGIICYNAFKNNEYPQLMAFRLLNDPCFDFQKKLLGEKSFALAENFFIHELISNFLQGGINLAVEQSDFFLLISSYVNLYPEDYYNQDTISKIIEIIGIALSNPEKNIKKIWDKYSHKEGEKLLVELKKRIKYS